MAAERIHHDPMGSFFFRAENPRPIAMNAHIAEISTIDIAISPRVLHPKNVTGVK